MLKLKEQVFSGAGYSSDLKLSSIELEVFRSNLNQQWLSVIKTLYPDIADEAEELGIENYHLIADKIDHKQIWIKQNRVLSQDVVNEIKKLPFISILKNEFGEFSLSDVIDTKQHYGREEVYWRLVRPNVGSDVGPLHKDSWFHGAVNEGYGMYSKDQVTVKIWIPIYCEPGKSGLIISPGSHLKDWKYHIEIEDGFARPVPDEDLSRAGAELISTEPGNLLIFNENTLHGGAINSSNKTRVSAEITMVMPRDNIMQTINL